ARPGRERLLASLVDRAGRSSGRTRAGVLDSALSLALLLTEADGAVLVLGGARHFERSVLRRGQKEPEHVGEAYRPAPFERPILRADEPRALALAASAASPAATCPGVSPGPALYVPLRLQDGQSGYLAAHRSEGSPRFTGRDARPLALLAAWTAVSLDNLRMSENLERLAVTDDLTQVFN